MPDVLGNTAIPTVNIFINNGLIECQPKRLPLAGSTKFRFFNTLNCDFGLLFKVNDVTISRMHCSKNNEVIVDILPLTVPEKQLYFTIGVNLPTGQVTNDTDVIILR